MSILLDLSVKAAESRILNPNNLESFWYGPWNIILSRLASFSLIVTPQQSLSFLAEHRDGKEVHRRLIPDFVATHYWIREGLLRERKHLVVENKRLMKNLGKEVSVAKDQLEDQIKIIFLDTSYSDILGVVAIGRHWRWYRYIRLKGHNPKTSWGNESYVPSDEEEVDVFEMKHESPMYDILDYKAIGELTEEVRKRVPN
ncbi:hypothetical protein K439DRAFT_207329 [Ramaria rubella]|nr:hypothetical protein K439DRAFT_207329 [Ramaria rubella]